MKKNYYQSTLMAPSNTSSSKIVPISNLDEDNLEFNFNQEVDNFN